MDQESIPPIRPRFNTPDAKKPSVRPSSGSDVGSPTTSPVASPTTSPPMSPRELKKLKGSNCGEDTKSPRKAGSWFRGSAESKKNVAEAGTASPKSPRTGGLRLTNSKKNLRDTEDLPPVLDPRPTGVCPRMQKIVSELQTTKKNSLDFTAQFNDADFLLLLTAFKTQPELIPKISEVRLSGDFSDHSIHYFTTICYLLRSDLITMSITDSKINSSQIKEIIESIIHENRKLQKLSFKNTKFDNENAIQLQKELSNTNITELDISNCSLLTGPGYKAIGEAVLQSKIRIFSAGRPSLSDAVQDISFGGLFHKRNDFVKLDISFLLVNSSVMKNIESFLFLTELNLTGVVGLTDQTITAFSSLVHRSEALETFNISNIMFPSMQELENMLCPAIAANKSLTALHVDHVILSDSVVSGLLTAVKKSPKIKTFTFANTMPLDLKLISELLVGNPRITHLDVSNPNAINLSSLLNTIIDTKTQLRFLVIDHIPCDSSGQKKLSEILKINYNLLHLSFGYSKKLSWESARPIFVALQEENKTLTSLDISGIKGKDKPAFKSFLTVLKYNTSLKKIYINDISADVGDKFLAQISWALYANPSIKEFSMKNSLTPKQTKVFQWSLLHHPMDVLDFSNGDLTSAEFVDFFERSKLGFPVNSKFRITKNDSDNLKECSRVLGMRYVRNVRYSYVNPLEKREKLIVVLLQAILKYCLSCGNGDLYVLYESFNDEERAVGATAWIKRGHPISIPTLDLLKSAGSTFLTLGAGEASKMATTSREVSDFWQKACRPEFEKILYFGTLLSVKSEPLVWKSLLQEKFNDCDNDGSYVWTFLTDATMMPFLIDLGFAGTENTVTKETQIQIWGLMRKPNAVSPFLKKADVQQQLEKS